MLTNFLKLIFILVCSCMQAEAGEAAKEDPDKQSTDIDSWFGDHLNRIYEMFFFLYRYVDCFQMSADLGQGAFDQKPTGLGCNIGCFAFCG